MKRLRLCALLLFACGCSRQNSTPVVVAAPRPTATVTPTLAPVFAPTIAPVAPPIVAPPINGTVANGQVSEEERQFIFSQIQMLKTASPDQDFETAWAKADYRVSGLNGAGQYYPGVPNNRVLSLVNGYGEKIIEGTGDFFQIPEQLELQQLAGKYALRYNQLLLARLDEQKPVIKPEISEPDNRSE